MSWVAVGIAAGGATISYLENRRQNRLAAEREDASRRANADATEVSWARKDGRGNIPEIQWAPIGKSDLGAALQGGLSGYMVGSSVKSGLDKAKTPGDGGIGTQSGTDAQYLKPQSTLPGDPSAVGGFGSSPQTMVASNPSNPMPGSPTMDWNMMGRQVGQQPNFFSTQRKPYMG